MKIRYNVKYDEFSNALRDAGNQPAMFWTGGELSMLDNIGYVLFDDELRITACPAHEYNLYCMKI